MITDAEIRHAEKVDRLKTFGDLGLRAECPNMVIKELDLATLMRDLDRLRDDDRKDRASDLTKKYRRLARAYALGIRLRDDDDLRDQFFGADHWRTFPGHKPKVGKHGREHAVHFAVMHVFGGAETRQDASLLARASTLLANMDVAPDGFVQALTNTPGKDGKFGPRALADLARAEERTARSEPPTVKPIRDRLVGTVGALRLSTNADFPAELSGDAYLIVVDGCITVSSHPEEFVPFPVTKPENVPAAA